MGIKVEINDKGLAQSKTEDGTPSSLLLYGEPVGGSTTPKAVVNVFTASAVMVEPVGALWIDVECVGGGGSGGGGRSGVNAVVATGGTGGGGGARSYRKRFAVSEISWPVTVTVASGGAASTATGNGSPGGNSSFGTYVVAYGGGRGVAYIAPPELNGVSEGAGGGTISVGTGGSVDDMSAGGAPANNHLFENYPLQYQSGGGGGSSIGGETGFMGMAGNAEFGGGAGSPVNFNGSTNRGGNGSSLYGGGGGGAGGGTNTPTLYQPSSGGNSGPNLGGEAGTSGPSPTAGSPGTNGSGGGGGGSSVTASTNGANGGAGGIPGGGGGGGGRAGVGGTGGLGGAGGRGEVRVWITYP